MSSLFHFRRSEKKTLDLEGRTPLIRCSICTGEETGGFRDEKTGQFIEVMKLSDASDYEEFFRMCGTDKIERIY